MTESENNLSYNIALVGNKGCGKSSLINRFITGIFDPQYNPTSNLSDVKKIEFNSNYKVVIFNTYEFNEMDSMTETKLKTLNLHGCIIMFDSTDKFSYNDINKWYDYIKTKVEIPVVFAASKVDIKNRKVRPIHIKYPKSVDCKYYDISSKSLYNSHYPFLLLYKIMSKNNNAKFTDYTLNIEDINIDRYDNMLAIINNIIDYKHDD